MSTITPKQQNFIRTLLVERAGTIGLDEAGVDALLTEFNIDRLTPKSASLAIDFIKSIKVTRVGASHLPSNAERTIVNRFNKPCALCGHEVQIGAGYACLVDKEWKTYHRENECVEGEAPVRVSSLNDILHDVVDGYYALRSTGKNDLVFYRVATNKGQYNPAKKGQRYVQLVVGGHANETLSGKRAVESSTRIAMLSPAERHEAMSLYGREIGKCGRCGRHLTDEASRARGLGSECASK
jgi:hypothetical protein